jgi:hypothetical protein
MSAAPAAAAPEVKEEKEPVLVPARNHRLPACIVAYQALLQGTCAANCGQPLVCGAGPGYTKTRIVLDGETAQWYHIRCYDTCSEDQWAKHTAQFTNAPDSKFHDDEQAAQCRDVVRHWTFLRDLTPEDLTVQCTPWTTCVAPSHLDRMLLHIGSDYAARSVWPDAVVANRPGPFQPFYEQMFTTNNFTQMAFVWRAEIAGVSDAHVRTGLSLIAQQLTEAVAALKPWGPQVYVQPRFYRYTGDPFSDHVIYLRLACQAVQGSTLHYGPFEILSRGNMAAQMRQVSNLLDSLMHELSDVTQTVLETTGRTVTEFQLKKPWELMSHQYRCRPITLPDKRLVLPVGLSTPFMTNYAYVAVGRNATSLAQLHIERAKGSQDVFVPYEIPHAKYARFSSILHADKVQVTPLSCIPLVVSYSSTSAVLPSGSTAVSSTGTQSFTKSG